MSESVRVRRGGVSEYKDRELRLRQVESGSTFVMVCAHHSCPVLHAVWGSDGVAVSSSWQTLGVLGSGSRRRVG